MDRILVVLLICGFSESVQSSQLDLPAEHLPFYFNSYPEEARACEADPECPFKPHLNKNVCWGYEENCDLNPRSYSHPICDGDAKGWAQSKNEQIETFYNQGDFGYIRNFKNSIKYICKPNSELDSSLECSDKFQFCRGRNIRIDFTGLKHRDKPIMYDTDVLKKGDIGGHCKLDKVLLESNLDFMSSLQSWAPEMRNFVETPDRISDRNSAQCDKIVKGPTIIMKIDATVNMYHHFCDFFNLYATLHLNSTKENVDAFSRNTRILIWRTYPYHSNFEAAFRAFSSRSVMDLNRYKGQKVCFENVIFPLLPRMIFGLYYNTPLIWGCRNSGLFHAFSKFMLHRLRIDQRIAPNAKKIKVTLLSRKTQYRRIINEDKLLEKLSENPDLVVKKVEFTHTTDFSDQLEAIQNTDILIGIHGAGLTHLLFLPDWAVVFEMYHCEDPNCYADLARLRGLKYLTWRDKTKLKVQDIKPELKSSYFEKHASYVFDPEEFLSILNEGIQHVKEQAQELNYLKRDEL